MRCEVCGNAYDKVFELRQGDAVRVFDSFECAIQAMAPTCRHCGCRILGHGIESAGIFYCCAHCAREGGVAGARDRLP
jgi:Rieske Fe-S protein